MENGAKKKVFFISGVIFDVKFFRIFGFLKACFSEISLKAHFSTRKSRVLTPQLAYKIGRVSAKTHILGMRSRKTVLKRYFWPFQNANSNGKPAYFFWTFMGRVSDQKRVFFRFPYRNSTLFGVFEETRGFACFKTGKKSPKYIFIKGPATTCCGISARRNSPQTTEVQS